MRMIMAVFDEFFEEPACVMLDHRMSPFLVSCGFLIRCMVRFENIEGACALDDLCVLILPTLSCNFM